mmetsp:Transcript_122582/g.354279  ORF Transcript_122582/g.354279 Transcript_122582/m.354279 type:complete len:101 (-) Transcript_122582:42-344(-)
MMLIMIVNQFVCGLIEHLILIFLMGTTGIESLGQRKGRGTAHGPRGSRVQIDQHCPIVSTQEKEIITMQNKQEKYSHTVSQGATTIHPSTILDEMTDENK